MNGFRNSSRNGQVLRYQRAGGRAVILEVSGRWMEAAEAWRRAACITGAVGEGCNEKSSLHYSRSQKAE
ncbi:hypothetical protein [Escherichia coli]|uniref:hypothetical protein n=1 Tax=Escherichia coli TaxID=562 RepID=UPI000B7CAF2E|nr:hypothetical protein [Escherichia coli]